jgi:hypothetical protein
LPSGRRTSTDMHERSDVNCSVSRISYTYTEGKRRYSARPAAPLFGKPFRRGIGITELNRAVRCRAARAAQAWREQLCCLRTQTDEGRNTHTQCPVACKCTATGTVYYAWAFALRHSLRRRVSPPSVGYGYCGLPPRVGR